MNLEHAKNLLESVKNTSEKYAEIFKDTKVEYGEDFAYNSRKDIIYIKFTSDANEIEEHRNQFVLDYVNEHYNTDIRDYEGFAFLHELAHAYEWLTTEDRFELVKIHYMKNQEVDRVYCCYEPILKKHLKAINKIYEKMIDIYDKKLYRYEFFRKHYDKKLDKLDIKINKHIYSYCSVSDIIDGYYRSFADESFADKWACEKFWDVTERAYEPWRN